MTVTVTFQLQQPKPTGVTITLQTKGEDGKYTAVSGSTLQTETTVGSKVEIALKMTVASGSWTRRTSRWWGR